MNSADFELLLRRSRGATNIGHRPSSSLTEYISHITCVQFLSLSQIQLIIFSPYNCYSNTVPRNRVFLISPTRVKSPLSMYHTYDVIR